MAIIVEDRIGLLIGQFIILLSCIFYIEYFYSENIYPDKRAKEVFVQTTCALLNKKLNAQASSPNNYLYRADFLIHYSVNNIPYTHWVSGNGLNTAFTKHSAPKEEILSQFNVGNAYPCWYDPNNPSIAILVMRHYWFSTFPLILPSIIGVIVFYFLLTNLLEIISNWLIKNRAKKP
ncbi:MAG: hypothetical protein A3F42_01070 [Gammaproteobacteria bacterium RIFCSPHIGHO2_12_FULL_37_34]|nr:MAG: hypothetical protein A3F42_01070 [Gammaproteobacteria bacterium RIFCSPHIGHO2_12_FULL_37_34]